LFTVQDPGGRLGSAFIVGKNRQSLRDLNASFLN